MILDQIITRNHTTTSSGIHLVCTSQHYQQYTL